MGHIVSDKLLSHNAIRFRYKYRRTYAITRLDKVPVLGAYSAALALKMKRSKYPNLKAWRAAHEWTQERAARELGLSLFVYVRYELGINHPRPQRLRELIEKTDVAIESLTGAVA